MSVCICTWYVLSSYHRDRTHPEVCRTRNDTCFTSPTHMSRVHGVNVRHGEVQVRFAVNRLMRPIDKFMSKRCARASERTHFFLIYVLVLYNGFSFLFSGFLTPFSRILCVVVNTVIHFFHSFSAQSERTNLLYEPSIMQLKT